MLLTGKLNKLRLLRPKQQQNLQLPKDFHRQTLSKFSLFDRKNSLTNNKNNQLYKWFMKTQEKIHNNFVVLSRLLSLQSNILITLQLRRFVQHFHLYYKLYPSHELKSILFKNNLKFFNLLKSYELRDSLINSLLNRFYLLSYVALCYAYNWNERIDDYEFDELIDDFVQNYDKNESNDIQNNNNCNDDKSEEFEPQDNDASFLAVNCMKANNNGVIKDWEEIIRRPNFYVLRKSVDNHTIYQYKVFGSFNDISAYSFYSVQKDLEYRKKWDKLVIKLDIIDIENINKRESKFSNHNFYDSGNELVHWIMKYPYPMLNREYIYIRRSIIDFNRNFIVLISRSITNSEIDESKEQVRVYDYMSHMVIKPYKTFDKPGFKFMLTYFDDPRASFPSPAYAWMAARGVPEFVERLHQAAIKFSDENPESMEEIFESFNKNNNDINNNDDVFDTANEDNDDIFRILNSKENAKNKYEAKINKFISKLPEPNVDLDSLIWN